MLPSRFVIIVALALSLIQYLLSFGDAGLLACCRAGGDQLIAHGRRLSKNDDVQHIRKYGCITCVAHNDGCICISVVHANVR